MSIDFARLDWLDRRIKTLAVEAERHGASLNVEAIQDCREQIQAHFMEINEMRAWQLYPRLEPGFWEKLFPKAFLKRQAKQEADRWDWVEARRREVYLNQ